VRGDKPLKGAKLRHTLMGRGGGGVGRSAISYVGAPTCNRFQKKKNCEREKKKKHKSDNEESRARGGTKGLGGLLDVQQHN